MVLATHVSAQEAQGVAGKSPAVEEQKTTKPDASRADGSGAGFPVTIAETPEQASNAEKRAKDADNHDAKDLDAQIRAADAAERSAAIAERQEVPALAQIIIGAASTFIAVIALIVSLLTAIVSTRTTRAQLRAYVCNMGAITPAGFDAPGGFSVVVEAKNMGPTPATKLTQWTLVALREYPLRRPLEPYTLTDFPTEAVLGPTAITMSIPTFGRSLEEWEKTGIKRCELAIYVYGEIDYVDAFNKRRATKFCMRSIGEQGYKLGVFKAHDTGNSYT
ncbi:hypothetical protein BPNPMPFG_000568 [Mesorhizobium sp. AR07]|uniref:hypothetical protein n=1 Tax=Mesorhizobium sp. AR07 TaxID=2865838 RepID=UPI00216057B4|nr:hypothetical protein [Mesorhizobium sp. AR07]UVK45074.1 hypothetical protein BPNPMPFG_000568 [Mesorhizobium sp. AR07]